MSGRSFEDPATTDESEESLWWLAAPPGAWLAHLLATYLTAANFCAKVPEHESLASVRWAIAAYTLAALIVLGLLGRRGWVRRRTGDSSEPHDLDSRADRHRFLGLILVLLTGAATLGVVFAALPAIFMENCR